MTDLRAWLLFALILPGLAMAGEGDTFRPVVTYGYNYDSNLLRQQDDAAARNYYNFFGQELAHSDTYQQLGVGFDLDWKQGRQRVVGKVRGSKTRFNHYGLLDYSGQDLNLEWQWQLGNLWSGRVGAKRTVSLGSFQELTGALVSNTRTNENRFFDANYRIHPRWQAGIKLNSGTYTYTAVTQRGSDTETDAWTAGIYFLGSTLQKIGVEVRESDIKYPNRTATAIVDTDVQDRSLNFVAEWEASGKSSLKVRVGRVERKNQHLPARDYSGLNWHLDGNYSLTGKSFLSASLFREVRNTEYTTSNHSLATGGTLGYYWQVLPKTRLQASLSQEDVNYDGIARQDTIKSATLAATYEPWSGGELSAGLQTEKRDSSTFLYSYKSNALFLNANLKF